MKILIADDSPTTQQLLSFYLKDLKNTELAFVKNGLEAMIKIERDAIDLLITDIIMPFIDGFKLISYIRHKPSLQKLPIIIISQKGDAKYHKQGLALGANAFLVKPINKIELLSKIKDLLISR